MSLANIKIPSTALKELKKLTGEKTSQKAVDKALSYFLRQARQRDIVKVLKEVSFEKSFNPLDLRLRER